jgi:hypothetical protein
MTRHTRPRGGCRMVVVTLVVALFVPSGIGLHYIRRAELRRKSLRQESTALLTRLSQISDDVMRSSSHLQLFLEKLLLHHNTIGEMEREIDCAQKVLEVAQAAYKKAAQKSQLLPYDEVLSQTLLDTEAAIGLQRVQVSNLQQLSALMQITSQFEEYSRELLNAKFRLIVLQITVKAQPKDKDLPKALQEQVLSQSREVKAKIEEVLKFTENNVDPLFSAGAASPAVAIPTTETNKVDKLIAKLQEEKSHQLLKLSYEFGKTIGPLRAMLEHLRLATSSLGGDNSSSP